MKFSRTFAAGALAFGVALGQNSTSTYVEPGVPTGTPIPGNYSGPLRPQIHFSPPQHFMNDPNGMFRAANGTWHLYYQYNPTGLAAGNQHWGHATSDDLYHWTNQPIAIFPPDDSSYIFSGSAIVDVNNTSGLFPDQDDGVVAIYTLQTGGTSGPQVQEISYSHDGGYSFTRYANNPVIDSTSSQFRDPKVIWYEDHWVMVVAYSQDFTIGIYTSPNLIDWTHASNFTHHGLLGLQYECPNMVEIPVAGSTETMYVLYISINPGAPQGGSIGQYFPGTFNGTHFSAVDSAARIADFAKDNYAAQFFYGVPVSEGAISIAWASNWQYTDVVPTGTQEGWRSAMSLPRRNSLANTTRLGWDLISVPYDMSPVLGAVLVDNSSLANSSLALDYSGLASNALYFAANISSLPRATSSISSYATLNVTFSSPVSGESLSFGYYFGGDNPAFISRQHVRGSLAENPFFTDKFSTTSLADGSGGWSVEGVIDRSLFEVFLDGGKQSGTVVFYPESMLTVMTVGTTEMPEGAEVDVKVWAVESAWE
ncbi:glycoside hydrolase family 32 protein [Saccharata proteae CBS 121410]|uniref:Glycoside hydrolase family 32 protein n=1 Tax=Saccharata proteae CBS 121410 TaxID=1314787 RepID=A0A9P4I2T0_9PEZI|nr:glycoside hydrolase family 32 protein [Saccharata proteae CBS 121410]